MQFVLNNLSMDSSWEKYGQTWRVIINACKQDHFSQTAIQIYTIEKYWLITC